MSDKQLFRSHRPGWVSEGGPGGCFVSWPEGVRPFIQHRHIDGPYVHFRNGEMHWLTLWERLNVWLGRADAMSLERKHRPHLQRFDVLPSATEPVSARNET